MASWLSFEERFIPLIDPAPGPGPASSPRDLDSQNVPSITEIVFNTKSVTLFLQYFFFFGSVGFILCIRFLLYTGGPPTWILMIGLIHWSTLMAFLTLLKSWFDAINILFTFKDNFWGNLYLSINWQLQFARTLLRLGSLFLVGGACTYYSTGADFDYSMLWLGGSMVAVWFALLLPLFMSFKWDVKQLVPTVENDTSEVENDTGVVEEKKVVYPPSPSTLPMVFHIMSHNGRPQYSVIQDTVQLKK